MKIYMLIGGLLLTCGQLNGQQLIDPTRPVAQAMLPPGNVGQGSSAMQLNAVFSQGPNKYAIINGETVQEGQQIAGLTLMTISPNGVVLTGNNGRQELFVNNTHFKKDSNNGF